jgi:raffinose/stachyose/melibiose transport system permease protein
MATQASSTPGAGTLATTARQRRVDVGRPTVTGTLAYLIMLAVAATILVPIGYAVLGGFKETGQLMAEPGSIVPDPWVFSNYTDVLFGEQAAAFWGAFWNSLVIATISVTITVLFASMAAYAFARMSFRGREVFYTVFVFGLLFPSAVAILPLSILVRDLGLVGNPLGVALPQAAFALPLTIVILRPFFRSIPGELEDAARIDGCGSFGFFWRVLLPLSRPALATVAVLAIVSTWNAFLLPLVLLNGAEQWTLPLGVMNFSTQFSSDSARILAYTVVAVVPAILFYAIAERHIVTGLTGGSLKG